MGHRLSILVLLLLSACNGFNDEAESKSSDSQSVGRQTVTKKHGLESVECWFDSPRRLTETACFFMHVPQDYARIEGLWIRFPVVRITEKSAKAHKTPVLHLGGGGPGNPMGFWPDEDVSWIWDMYQGLAVDTGRDLYIIDPRGIGYTEPALSCFEYAKLIEQMLGETLSVEEENNRSLDAYQVCRERLEKQGVDFSFYNSITVAQDVEQLRSALGIAQWNLYGVSYGSRYAQIIARQYPLSVESMILDAATFPDINYTERSGDDFMRTFERLFDYCDRDPLCSRRFGDVRKSFWTLVEELERNPLEYEISHPFSGQWMNINITGMRFLNAYFNALYSAEYYAALPDIIKSLTEGELGKFENAIFEWVYYLMDPNYGDAVAIAHFCNEEAPFVNLGRALNRLNVLPSIVREVAEAEMRVTFQQCADWKIKPANNLESQPVVTSVPTLFLHGALDPVLPVEDLDLRMVTFQNSVKLVFDNISHTVVGVHPCGVEVARAFYDSKLEFRDFISCDL